MKKMAAGGTLRHIVKFNPAAKRNCYRPGNKSERHADSGRERERERERERDQRKGRGKVFSA